MFNWLKKTAKKTDDTLDQVKTDLSDTMACTLSKHKYRKMPAITIQNLYIGDKFK